MSPKFAKCAITIAGLALAVEFIHLPVITTDRLLAAYWWARCWNWDCYAWRCGSGWNRNIGLINEQRQGSWGHYMCVNVVIFSVAAFFLSIESILYSIITIIGIKKWILSCGLKNKWV